MWSSPFWWDMDAIRKSKIRLRKNSFSAVIIPYISTIVKRLLSTLKICIAVVKEKSVAITATLVAAPEDSNLTGGPFYVFDPSHYFDNLLRCRATPQVEIPRMPINMILNNFMNFSPLSSISIVSPFLNSLVSFIDNTDNKNVMETIKGNYCLSLIISALIAYITGTLGVQESRLSS